MDKKELQRIISLTFDENPVVRKEAALKLAESDDPGATFALLELSYDKEEAVKAAAREILSKKQPQDKDAISFAEIFSKGAEKEGEIPAETPAAPEDATRKKKLLHPIERIFEKGLGKTKAAMMKSKMMPTIERVYTKAVGSGPEEMEKREKSIQKMLTSYVDILSGLDKIMFEEMGRESSAAEVQTINESTEAAGKEGSGPEEGLEEVGTEINTAHIGREIAELEAQEDGNQGGEPAESAKPADEPGQMCEKSVFRKAYDIMMASDGDEEMMFQQSQKIARQLADEVNLAFKMAKQSFKAENIIHLTELKNGMRSVHTDALIVREAKTGEYPRTKTKMDSYTRIVVNDDEGSEGIIYLFEGRGKEVQPGMRVKVVKGQVKTFAFSGETAITIGKKGSVYIVL